MVNTLNFETVPILCNIRTDQNKELDKINYLARVKANIKTSKTGLVRISLDNLFKLDFDKILKLVELEKNNDN
jgi:hypothetical protein